MERNEYHANIALAGRVLGPLLLFRPDSERCAPIIEELRSLPSFEAWPFGSESDLSRAYALVSEGLSQGVDRPLVREYSRLFEGPAAFAAPVWGSVYLDRDCVVFGESTLELRWWMKRNGIAITYPEREPEDQIGRMLMLMSWLAENKSDLLSEMLSEHLLTWSHHFFELFMKDARHPFYEGIALLADTTLSAIKEDLGLVVPVKRFYR